MAESSSRKKYRIPRDPAEQSRLRSRILKIASLVTALIILGRFAFIMLSGDRDQGVPVKTPAVSERGSITDRNGRLIALQTRLWSVTRLETRN